MDNMDLKEKRRMEIIQAAMRVFSKNGFERTKMEAIAAEAGIGKGTIYEYFSSKKQLFEEMIDLNLDKYRENLYKIVKDEQSFYQKLHSLCRYHADFLNQHLDIIRFTSHDGTLLSHSMKKRLLKERKEVFQMLNEMLEEAISRGEVRRDIDRQAAILCITGVILQLMGQRIFIDNANASDIDLAPLLDILMRGLGNK